MSIADKITRLTTARANIRTAIDNKGGSASSHGFEDFAADINAINTQKPEQSKTVTPTTAGFTVSPDSGKVLSSVVVNGDADLIAGNIKNGVDIFGVIGTLSEGNALLVEHTITSSSVYYTTVNIANATRFNNYCILLKDTWTIEGNKTIAVLKIGGTVYTAATNSSGGYSFIVGGSITINANSVQFTSTFNSRYFVANKAYAVLGF